MESRIKKGADRLKIILKQKLVFDLQKEENKVV